MRSITRLALAGVITAAAVTAAAVPAFASGTPVSMTASVGQSVSLSGLSTIAFGSGVPGQTLTYAETYAVATNDQAGFTVTVQDTGGANALTLNGGSASISDSHVTVKDTDPSQPLVTLSGSAQPVFSNGLTQALTDNWSLTIPANQAPGAYSTTVTYAVTGN
jgi:hypothetical protein